MQKVVFMGRKASCGVASHGIEPAQGRPNRVPFLFEGPKIHERQLGADRHCDCRVQSGRWVGPYSGEVFTDPGDLHIDHLVPLANAHVSGGWAWNEERREAFANNLDNPEHLLAVKAGLNMSKGATSGQQNDAST